MPLTQADPAGESISAIEEGEGIGLVAVMRARGICYLHHRALAGGPGSAMAMWLLEKLAPDEYGLSRPPDWFDRREMAREAEATAIAAAKSDFSGWTDEELQAEIETDGFV